MKKRVESDSDSGSDEDMDDSDSESDSSDSDAPKKKRGKPKAKAKAKGKSTTKGKNATKGKAKKNDERDESEAPPAAHPRQFEMWKQGGSNVESSAKMLQMIAYLKEWESTGDKTIVFSQCGWPFVFCCACVRSDACTMSRDVNAGLVRAGVCAPRDPEPSL